MLLLRQIDVLLSQYTNHKLSQKIQIDEVNFYSKNETEILNLLRLYGKFNIQSLNISDICEEEYEDDQMNIMHSKPFQKDETIRCNVLDNKKIIKDKCNLLNESIINMTLNESKELIQKSTGLVASVGDKLKKELNIVENDNKKQKQVRIIKFLVRDILSIKFSKNKSIHKIIVIQLEISHFRNYSNKTEPMELVVKGNLLNRTKANK